MLKPGGFDAEPINFKLILTNTSKEPIRINTQNFGLMYLKATVVVPGEDSVQVQHRAAGLRPVLPTENDIVTIKAGETWSPTTTYSLPGRMPEGSATTAIYTILKPGEFRVRFTYEPTPIPAEAKLPECWVGELVSNELVLKVK